MPCKVNGIEVSAILDVLMSSFKACRPVFTRLLTTRVRGLQGYYCWCRWQTPVIEPASATVYPFFES
jgi:hypothetical protein